MINFIKNWWNSEWFFLKNPFFWLLTAGACAAAPFTGFLSLAAIPVFAGLAQTGYLPYEKLWAGFKWLLWGNLVDKGSAVPQDEKDETQSDSEERSSSFDSHQSILEQIGSSLYSTYGADGAFESALVLYEGAAPSLEYQEYSIIVEVQSDLREKEATEASQAEGKKFTQLADEAILALEWIYRYGVQLNLDSGEIQQINSILSKIPETGRPSCYPEEQKAVFFIMQKQGIFFDDAHFSEKMDHDGKKIATRLLLRFHEDKTRLPDTKTQLIPLNTSRLEIAGTTLQFVCQMLNRLLSDIFIQKKKESTSSSEQTRSSKTPSKWKVSPRFWQRCNEAEDYFDNDFQQTRQERKKTRENIKKKKQHVAEMDRENLDKVARAILKDNSDFDNLRSRLNYPTEVLGRYLTESEHIKGLINESRLESTTVDNLIIAIIKNDDKQLTLTLRCVETPENPNGFITKGKIELLVQERKLPQKILQKLGFAPLQQAQGSWFAFVPSLTKSDSDSSHSSSASSEEKKDGDEGVGKKKVEPAVQQALTMG